MEYLSNKTVLVVGGDEASKFLNGLFTKNTINLQADLTYCFMLNAQGKYLYELFLYKYNNEFLIEIHEDHLDSFIAKLRIYKLRAQVTINHLPNYKIIWSAQAFLGQSITSYIDPRLHDIGYRTIVDIKHYDIAAVVPNTDSAYRTQKYNLAIPDYQDLQQEKSFPLEFGFDKLNAIDFDKGCYIGQELVARTFYRGVVRKTIFKIEADINFSDILSNYAQIQKDPLISLNDKETTDNIIEIVTENNMVIGKVLSFYNNMAIAQIRTEELAAAQANKLATKVGDQLVKITVPRWRY